MTRIAPLLTALILPTALAAQTPDFSGSFSMQGQNGPVVVSLQSAGGGQYTGTMSGAGLTWQLQGDIFEDALTGTVDTGQGVMAFEAYVYGSELELILVEIGPDGMPKVDEGQEFIFTRTQGGAPSAQTPAPQAQVPSAAFPGFSQGGAAPAGTDPFVGDFTNGQLTLSLRGDGGSYSGQLAMGAEAHPVTAQLNGDRLEGTMTAPAGQYGLLITASADGVVLSNAGEDYVLQRIAPGGGSAPAAPTGPGRATPGQGQPGQGQVDNSPLAQQWRQYLAGKKVTYMDSYSSNTPGGGGFSTKFIYHLCSNGQFSYSGSDVVSHNIPNTDVPGGGSAGSASGTWRIVTQGQLAGIELRYANGQTELYQLDMQGNATYANGERVYVTPGEMCY